VTLKAWGRLGRKAKPDLPIVVVSGLPRSGTSMMMRMLTAGGIEPMTDGLRHADGDNPAGYYELERVKKLPSGDTAWLSDARGKAVKVIAALLFDLPDDYRYRVIFMRRHMTEILASQRKMLVNRGQDPDAVADDDMARLFEGHLERVERWSARKDNVSRLDIDYNALVTGGGSDGAELIASFLHRPLDVVAMAAVVDPALYRRRA
jgi:hypothetical protein